MCCNCCIREAQTQKRETADRCLLLSCCVHTEYDIVISYQYQVHMHDCYFVSEVISIMSNVDTFCPRHLEEFDVLFCVL